jgi:hypothetical protein
MTTKRIVDNTNRPAQPEPGQDPAVKKAPVREQGEAEAEEEVT